MNTIGGQLTMNFDKLSNLIFTENVLRVGKHKGIFIFVKKGEA
jgi:hypothetical protein